MSHFIINGVNSTGNILEDNRLRLDNADNEDVVQEGRLAFRELAVATTDPRAVRSLTGSRLACPYGTPLSPHFPLIEYVDHRIPFVSNE